MIYIYIYVCSSLKGLTDDRTVEGKHDSVLILCIFPDLGRAHCSWRGMLLPLREIGPGSSNRPMESCY